MTNISQFSIEKDVYLNHFSSDIFKNLDVDNQMYLKVEVRMNLKVDPKMPFLAA